jgi:methionyl-tRNA synthetase
MADRILITAALPYANGSIHLGHLLEHIQVDVFTRGQRLCGHDAVFLCADDTHGTPIEVNARKQGIAPEELVARSFREHVADFRDFLIDHAHYGSTNSAENQKYAELFYNRLKAAGRVFTRDVEQMYCEHDGRFLPDRFIRGTCPRCKAPDQYGDTCEACSSTHEPTDLLEPQCSLCGGRPVLRSSTHYFFDLPGMGPALRSWLDAPGSLQPDVRNFVETWYREGLKAWDISRDGPYFGFKIPGEENKYFYVWLDAPIGYVSTTEQFCGLSGRSFEDYWSPQAQGTRIYHFVGKDIIYFHALFWPAMLMAAEMRLPNALYVHGMLTVDGTKMSKSRGTFINARTYLNHLPPELLRWYVCTKLSGRVEDVDINLDDFMGRCNADLVNNIVNLCSRAIPFVHGKLGGEVAPLSGVADAAAVARLRSFEQEGLPAVGEAYGQREYGAVTRRVLELTDFANKYMQDNRPWDQLKQDRGLAMQTLSVALNAVKLAAVALQPILPAMTDALARMLHLHDGDKPWAPTLERDGRADLGGEAQRYGPFTRLLERVERASLDAVLDETRGGAPAVRPAEPVAKAGKQPKQPKAEKKPAEPPPPLAQVGLEDFQRLDLRVGLVVEAEVVEGADKLVKLRVDLGDLGVKQVFAGIRKAYAPEQLKGRRVVVLANLAPRTMKFGVSEAMVLAAESAGGLHVLAPDGEPPTGSKVR